MVSSNVVQRTFQIRFNGGTGTAFTVDLNGRQYLVTARHVVEGITSDDLLEIYQENEWKSVIIKVTGVGVGNVDVTVLACTIQLSPTTLLEPTMDRLAYGQQIYFLGFPYGTDGGSPELNRNFPIPLVKSGVVSAILRDDDNNPMLLLDGHNNPGFSGGPVVFTLHGTTVGPTNPYYVAGIVHGYNAYGESVLDSENNEIGRFFENPGIVIVYGIQCAIDLIDANPNGFVLPTS